MLTGREEVDGQVVLSENMWPASHRRDRLLRECRCIVTDNAEDIEEALLVASQGRAAVGIQLDGVDAESAVRSAAELPASFAFPPDTIRLQIGFFSPINFMLPAAEECACGIP